MTGYKYEGRYCHDCGNYKLIIHECRRGHLISFKNGCNKCGTAQPRMWVHYNKDCEDYFDNPNLQRL